jgi:signal transduction histidine kinase
VHPKPDPRFLAITAHDLRGAVGVFDGALKELTRELPKDNADASKLTLMMGRSSQRLLLLGDRLSTLAKLMDGSELELGDAGDLTSLVRDATNRAFGAHARRTLQLHFEGAPVSVSVHAQSFAAAVSELTALFCSFSQNELSVSVSTTDSSVRIAFESDNASESVHRALRDRSATTQANAGISFAEAVLSRHNGALELPSADGVRAAIRLMVARSAQK